MSTEHTPPRAVDIREVSGLRESSIDWQSGLVIGAKILGLSSTNGRTYTPDAVREAASKYEGSPVYIDHVTGRGDGARSYRDRFGTITGVQYREGEGLFGDLRINKEHALAGQFQEDAKNRTKGVGLSHDVRGQVERRGGKQVVTSIEAVRSVDVVADPATTVSLFESQGAVNMSTETTSNETHQQRRQAIREDVKRIRSFGRQSEADGSLIDDLAEQMFAGEIDYSEAHRQLLEDHYRRTRLQEVRSSRPQVDGGYATGGRDISERGRITAAVLHELGASETVARHMGERVAEQTRDVGFGGVVEGLCRMKGRANAPTKHREQVDMLLKESGFTTLDLDNVLGDAINLVLLDDLATQSQTWRAITKVTSAADFRQQNYARMVLQGDVSEVGPDGEFKHNTASDEAFTNEVSTYGELFRVTRKDMINDRLGAFAEVPRKLGRKAMRKVADLVYGTLMSADTDFFHDDFNNLLDGGTSALGLSSLVDAVASLRTMQDAEGNDLDLVPASLVVSPSLEAQARALLESETIQSSEGDPMGNSMKSIAKLVVEPRLENTTKFSGASATQWFLAAGPETAPMIGSFLDGREAPTIEFFGLDSDANTLGLTWRVYIDFGAALGDKRCIIKSDGA